MGSGAGGNAVFVICVILMVLGLLLAGVFAALWFASRSRARENGGTAGPGWLIGGLLSVLLLTLLPGIFLLVRPAASGSGSNDPNRTLADVLTNGATANTGSGGAGSGGKPEAEGGETGNPEPVDGPVRAPAPAPAAPTPPADPALAARLQGAVDLMRRQLPLRSGPTTISSVEARGTQLVLNASIDVAVPSGNWSVMDQALTAQICSGEFAQVIRMGGSAVVNMRDSSGQTHATNVSRCP